MTHNKNYRVLSRMGRTSTRYKIKYQAEQIERYFHRIEDSAMVLDKLCADRNPDVVKALPLFMAGLDVCRKLWETLRKTL